MRLGLAIKHGGHFLTHPILHLVHYFFPSVHLWTKFEIALYPNRQVFFWLIRDLLRIRHFDWIGIPWESFWLRACWFRLKILGQQANRILLTKHRWRFLWINLSLIWNRQQSLPFFSIISDHFLLNQYRGDRNLCCCVRNWLEGNCCTTCCHCLKNQLYIVYLDLVMPKALASALAVSWTSPWGWG